MIGRLTRKLLVRLGVALHQVNSHIARATLPKFGGGPKNLVIQLPREIRNPERMTIGDDVKLGPGSVLKANLRYPGSWLLHPEGKHRVQDFTPELVIGNRVTATGSLQVVAYSKVVIEDDVTFAANVYISDGSHGYQNAHEPYKYQGIDGLAPIVIKRGTWIGQNAVILPGVTIGECAIIGANSVVTKSVPDKCIAAGAPARVIKRWDEAAQAWVPVGSGKSRANADQSEAAAEPDRAGLTDKQIG